MLQARFMKFVRVTTDKIMDRIDLFIMQRIWTCNGGEQVIGTPLKSEE